MMQRFLAIRGLVAMAIATAVGAWGLYRHPVEIDNPFLALIALQKPLVLKVLTYGYARPGGAGGASTIPPRSWAPCAGSQRGLLSPCAADPTPRQLRDRLPGNRSGH